jgi:hypothetical protein
MVEFVVTVPGGTGGGYYIDGVQGTNHTCCNRWYV